MEFPEEKVFRSLTRKLYPEILLPYNEEELEQLILPQLDPPSSIDLPDSFKSVDLAFLLHSWVLTSYDDTLFIYQLSSDAD
jgi:hypothetical protein